MLNVNHFIFFIFIITSAFCPQFFKSFLSLFFLFVYQGSRSQRLPLDTVSVSVVQSLPITEHNICLWFRACFVLHWFLLFDDTYNSKNWSNFCCFFTSYLSRRLRIKTKFLDNRLIHIFFEFYMYQVSACCQQSPICTTYMCNRKIGISVVHVFRPPIIQWYSRGVWILIFSAVASTFVLKR